MSYIVVTNACEHNLKGITLKIPRNQITVVTGLSGSGKSSLAFDTIYAEGQRRYIESLSAYARNYVEQFAKPKVDSITGLSPSIAIDQKSVSNNPRSTVGTLTEIYDYLRLLFARVGRPLCPTHKIPVSSQTPAEIIEEIKALPINTKFYILAPVAQGKKGEFTQDIQKWARKGFVKAKIDGKFILLEQATKLAKTKSHEIDLVVDQLINEGSKNDSSNNRLGESVRLALELAKGQVVIETLNGVRRHFSIHSVCPECRLSFPALEPRLFSFNNPRGYCPDCRGLGTTDLVEEEEYVYESGAKVLKGVKWIAAIAKKQPNRLVKNEANNEVTGEATGEIAETTDETADQIELSKCPTCHGARLRQESLNVLVGDKNIHQISSLSMDELKEEFTKSNLTNNLTNSLTNKMTSKEKAIAEPIIEQILYKAEYAIKVGTGYLSLDRSVTTLSGGESQRLRLATQIGSGLTGVLYVLDEPSIGLHPRDHRKLLNVLQELKARKNTILMVEHDEETILNADYVFDLGPRAGVLGGEIVAQGTPAEICQNPNSITGKYLRRELVVSPLVSSQISSSTSRKLSDKKLILQGARGHNLKNVTVEIPVGTLAVVTGVSGSGKSTLIVDTLYREMARRLNRSTQEVAPFEKIVGAELFDKVIEIDQAPIGRTSKSTPATFVGLFSSRRDLFASLPESKMRGFKPGHFSFNTPGGRCETCKGNGRIRLEMRFLADVFVCCEVCGGGRYSNEVTGIKYKGYSIADILAMSVEQSLEVFKNQPKILSKLETLHRVGLDYMTLGQASTTLSGGEAQRIKLSRELSKRATGQTLYILDEPTTGLHFEDIRKLIEFLGELVNQGNTVLVIEHNLEVMKSADWLIDLGPEGGRYGGEVLVQGPPSEVAQNSRSYTGQFLKPFFKTH